MAKKARAIVLDSWAIMAYLEDEPAAARVADLIADANEDGVVNCADIALVRASFGKRAGQAGFDERADVNRDGIVNIIDLTFVSKQLPAGTRC